MAAVCPVRVPDERVEKRKSWCSVLLAGGIVLLQLGFLKKSLKIGGDRCCSKEEKSGRRGAEVCLALLISEGQGACCNFFWGVLIHWELKRKGRGEEIVVVSEIKQWWSAGLSISLRSWLNFS